MAFIPDHIYDGEDVVVETRDLYPSHFLFKIENFSLLSENGIDNYETTDFDAGGYKWKLIFYPNGRESCDNGDKGDHISVSLAMSDTTSLPATWEVNAVFTVFLLNQKLDNFLTMRGRARRFHAMKQEWGYSNFISRKSLTEPSNGYLVDDNCVFGAEVFVIESQRAIECLSVLKDEKPYKHSLTISNFSKLLQDSWKSEKFILGNQTWSVKVYPRGCNEGKGRDVSIYLNLVASKPSSHRKLKYEFTLRIKNWFTDKHCTKRLCNWFTPPSAWGSHSIISIGEMNDPNKGFVVGDCCIIEVEVLLQAIARDSLL